MKNFVIVSLIFLAGCCSTSKLDGSKFFEVKFNQLEMWFDAMPKIESKSKFHLILDYSLKNVSKRNLKIDSLSYELVLSNVERLIFYDERFQPIELSSDKTFQFQRLNLSSNIDGLIPKNDRKADFYLNVYFMVGDKNYFEKVLIGSQEFEIVY
jgi:hypothetical protein